mmetsp:Transcript_123132/g.347967  ORF Transcript_123132/g.347967 Transcript_123132/m.347967 type:complete len:298 (+) Transcript_123132:69-962(+)
MHERVPSSGGVRRRALAALCGGAAPLKLVKLLQDHGFRLEPLLAGDLKALTTVLCDVWQKLDDDRAPDSRLDLIQINTSWPDERSDEIQRHLDDAWCIQHKVALRAGQRQWAPPRDEHLLERALDLLEPAYDHHVTMVCLRGGHDLYLSPGFPDDALDGLPAPPEHAANLHLRHLKDLLADAPRLGQVRRVHGHALSRGAREGQSLRLRHAADIPQTASRLSPKLGRNWRVAPGLRCEHGRPFWPPSSTASGTTASTTAFGATSPATSLLSSAFVVGRGISGIWLPTRRPRSERRHH